MKKLLLLLFIGGSLLRSNAQVQYPDNIFPDTAFAPFIYGVASGDPLTDRVIIWTKVDTRNSVEVKWQMATDSLFTNIVHQGTAEAKQEHDKIVSFPRFLLCVMFF